MKKIFLTAVLLLLGNYLFCQTWTIRQDEDFDVEYSVITREQWNRLREQKLTQRPWVGIEYVDEIERKRTLTPSRVISGTRPNLKGYYYLLYKVIPRNDAARNAISAWYMDTTFLRYGNTNTGYFSMSFFSSYPWGITDAFESNSDAFTSRYNQYMRWVNGE